MSGTVLHVVAIVLIVGNVLALVAGVALLIAPQQVIRRLGLSSEHPLSVRRLTKPLEQQHDSETLMLRYPQVLGAALLAGGIFVLIKWSYFAATLSGTEGGRTLARLYPGAVLSAPVWESLWVAALVLILIGALLAIAVGALALLRVETLKYLSRLSNRWVSTRQAAKPVSHPYYGFDRLVAAHPQVWGGIITALALYTLVMIAWFGRV